MNFSEYKPFVTRLHELGFILDSALGYSLRGIIDETIDMGHLVRLQSIRNLYLSRYANSVLTGRLKAIEQIDHWDKLVYWEEAGKYTIDRQTRTEMSKVLYTINYLCDKYGGIMI